MSVNHALGLAGGTGSKQNKRWLIEGNGATEKRPGLTRSSIVGWRGSLKHFDAHCREPRANRSLWLRSPERETRSSPLRQSLDLIIGSTPGRGEPQATQAPDGQEVNEKFYGVAVVYENEVGRCQPVILKIGQAVVKLSLNPGAIPSPTGEWLNDTADV